MFTGKLGDKYSRCCFLGSSSSRRVQLSVDLYYMDHTHCRSTAPHFSSHAFCPHICLGSAYAPALLIFWTNQRPLFLGHPAGTDGSPYCRF